MPHHDDLPGRGTLPHWKLDNFVQNFGAWRDRLDTDLVMGGAGAVIGNGLAQLLLGAVKSGDILVTWACAFTTAAGANVDVQILDGTDLVWGFGGNGADAAQRPGGLYVFTADHPDIRIQLYSQDAHTFTGAGAVLGDYTGVYALLFRPV